MKFLLFIITTSILLFGCKGDQESHNRWIKDSTESANNDAYLNDTSFYYLKKLLNKKPEEVSQVLGNPDKGIYTTKDCDYLSSCKEGTYQSEKYRILYTNNKVKWIEAHISGLKFDKSVPVKLGFGNVFSSVYNQNMIHWKDFSGIRLLAALPNKNGNQVDYIILDIDEKSDTTF